MPLDIDLVEECYLEAEIPTTTESATSHAIVRTSDSKIRALAKNEIPVNAHSHENGSLKFTENNISALAAPAMVLKISQSQVLTMGRAPNSPMIIISGEDYVTRKNSVHLEAGSAWLRVGPSGVAINSTVSTTYALKLANTGKALAEGWYTYASSVKNKTKIVEISDAVSKVEAIKGITFEQDGVNRAGITAEDLDSTGLPGATIKDDVGKYEAINQMVLIPLLVQAIKELAKEIKVLKK